MARLNRQKKLNNKPRIIKRIRRGSRLTVVNTILCSGLYILILYPEIGSKLKVFIEKFF